MFGMSPEKAAVSRRNRERDLKRLFGESMDQFLVKHSLTVAEFNKLTEWYLEELKNEKRLPIKL